MKEEEERETIREATNVINAASCIIKATVDKDIKDLKYWRKSIKTWQGRLDKKISRYLKEIKEEKIPF